MLPAVLTSPTLRARLRWDSSVLASAEASRHRAAMARGAVYLYAFGAALAFASLAFPSEGRDSSGIVGIALAALAGAGLHWLAFDRLPVLGFQLSGTAGTALVTLAALLGGEGGGAYAFFYLWVVLYAFFFYEVVAANSYASPQVEALFGYTQEEWETNNGLLERVIHPGDRERALAAATHLRETGDPMRLEYRFVARDGRIVWVYDETHLVRDENGDPAGVRGFLLDITERKEAEEALGDREERFHAMVANVPGAIFRCAYDEEWTMEFVSDAIEKISGYPASDFIGNRVRSFASIIHPDEQESLAPSVAEFRPYEIEYRIVHASGDVRWVLERGQAVRSADGVPRIDGAIFDVSETRRAAQALLETKEYSETLIRTANVMIVGLDPDGRVRIFNEAAEKITGYAQAELEGENWFEVLVPRDRYPETWESFVRWREAGELPEDFESPILTKAGEGRLVSWRNSMVEQGGRVVGSISFGIDITAGKHLEEQLRQSQKMEAVGRLAGGIAHDFNNILLPITGYCDFALARLGEDGPAAEDVREIQKAADRATGLTRQLLAFSRKQVLQPQLVDLNEVVTDLEGMLRRLIGDHIELAVELEEGVGQVLVDRGQIEQVLMNLVLNARDAMPEGGTLSLATRSLELSQAADERQVGLEPGRHARERHRRPHLPAPSADAAGGADDPRPRPRPSPRVGDDPARRGRGGRPRPRPGDPRGSRLHGAGGRRRAGGSRPEQDARGRHRHDGHRRGHAGDERTRAGGASVALAAGDEGPLHLRLHGHRRLRPRRPRPGIGVPPEALQLGRADTEGARGAGRAPGRPGRVDHPALRPPRARPTLRGRPGGG